MACKRHDDMAETVERRVIPSADSQSVRGLLADLAKAEALTDMDADLRGAAELVLAEVLNNIVEHAYATEPGKIEVTLRRIGGCLMCHVVDAGGPMPGGMLPTGVAAPPCGDDLPEGGFGWHLIRSLSRDMAYTREGGVNHLRFLLDADNGHDSGTSLPDWQR
jgi:serine/threonine-protein kinase RsbW